jgi:hypothetical protein
MESERERDGTATEGLQANRTVEELRRVFERMVRRLTAEVEPATVYTLELHAKEDSA